MRAQKKGVAAKKSVAKPRASKYKAKTVPTKASAESYVAAIENESRRADCAALLKLMKRFTKKPAVMWGSSIVGFGSTHFKYDSGHEGDILAAGFSSRTNAITLYLHKFPDYDALLKKLGKHKTSKACLYVNKLADIDMKVLEELIRRSVENVPASVGY